MVLPLACSCAKLLRLTAPSSCRPPACLPARPPPAESGETQAERLLQLYEADWGQSVDPYFSPEFSY